MELGEWSRSFLQAFIHPQLDVQVFSIVGISGFCTLSALSSMVLSHFEGGLIIYKNRDIWLFQVIVIMGKQYSNLYMKGPILHTGL